MTIVVDGLDEVEPVTGGANTLFLPELPREGLRFVVARRRDAGVRLLVKTEMFAERNLGDFADGGKDTALYIRRRIERGPLRALLGPRRRRPFVEKLSERSGLNFMYLRHALTALENHEFEVDDLDNLPKGLEPYYEDHWRRMVMTHPDAGLDTRIIYLLCESLTPMSCAGLVAVLRRGGGRLSHEGVQRTLDRWASFLRSESSPGEAKQYRFYHDSFRTFLRRKDIVKAAGVDLSELSQHLADDVLESYRA